MIRKKSFLIFLSAILVLFLGLFVFSFLNKGGESTNNQTDDPQSHLDGSDDHGEEISEQDQRLVLSFASDFAYAYFDTSTSESDANRKQRLSRFGDINSKPASAKNAHSSSVSLSGVDWYGGDPLDIKENEVAISVNITRVFYATADKRNPLSQSSASWVVIVAKDPSQERFFVTSITPEET